MRTGSFNVCVLAISALALWPGRASASERSNLSIVCVQVSNGLQGARDFIQIELNEDYPHAKEVLQQHFESHREVGDIRYRFTHYHDLIHPRGEDPGSLRAQMREATAEQRYGSPIMIDTRLGSRTIAYRGDYFAADGSPLSRFEAWSRFSIFLGPDKEWSMQGLDFSDKPARIGVTGRVSDQRTYMCSAPEYTDTIPK